MKIISIVLVTIFSFSSSLFYAQDNADSQQQSTTSLKDRLTLGLGAGVDHSYLGMKVTFDINEKLGIHTSIGENQLRGAIPALGLEYRLPTMFKGAILPYTFVTVGKDYVYEVYASDFTSNPGFETTRSVFMSANLGAALKYSSEEHPLLSFYLGVTYRFTDNEKSKALYDSFAENETIDYEYTNGNQFLPTAGIAFNLKHF